MSQGRKEIGELVERKEMVYLFMFGVYLCVCSHVNGFQV